MAKLVITYKVVCDKCKEELDFDINFPETLHGMEEISIKPCNCQVEHLRTISKAIENVKLAIKEV